MWPYAVFPAVLAAVFLIAGLSKLRRPQLVLDALQNFGVPRVFHRRPVSLALPLAEILLGISLLVTSGWVYTATAVATTAATIVFVFLTARALARGDRFDCGCFGAVHSPISRAIVLRNVLLAAAALGATVLGLSGFDGLIPAVAMVQGGDAAWIIVATFLVALATTLVHSTRAAPDTPAPPVPGNQLTGTALPDLYLTTSNQEPVRLLDMLEEHPHMIVTVRPGCLACTALLNDADSLRARLPGDAGLLLVVAGDEARFRSEHPDLAAVSLFNAWALAESLRLSAYPGAALVSRGGTILSEPVAGSPAILSLASRASSLLTTRS
ncbi:MauE/DoxX family redox-associated membrane protein [Microbacterium sp. W4I20]|uniref:MauE/DoxX family redox-associated membrane protein n=1 Tax=Microbacterium sp. W4I20 TaxID=3042262 RepID=UPI002780FCCD|nr:MauE/DoxX family redox-associated membrane protein [Microbacterium sp. W4I20]MDQ0729173.1 hypothetical protein [Microbacterium sp. W4I20]